jgi:hypothetical protein
MSLSTDSTDHSPIDKTLSPNGHARDGSTNGFTAVNGRSSPGQGGKSTSGDAHGSNGHSGLETPGNSTKRRFGDMDSSADSGQSATVSPNERSGHVEDRSAHHASAGGQWSGGDESQMAELLRAGAENPTGDTTEQVGSPGSATSTNGEGPPASYIRTNAGIHVDPKKRKRVSLTVIG